MAETQRLSLLASFNESLKTIDFRDTQREKIKQEFKEKLIEWKRSTEAHVKKLETYLQANQGDGH